MQTFLPHADFERSAKCLDNKRLFKQVLEAYMIVEILEGRPHRYVNHPAVLMWKGFVPALKVYTNCCILEWKERGFRNNSKPLFEITEDYSFPKWFGDIRLHSSHRVALLTKNFEHYSKFGWMEKPNPEYVNFWPTKNGY